MKYVLILLFFTRVWALEDRALFSVGDKVYFVKELNTYIDTLNDMKCSSNISLIKKFIDSEKDFHPLSPSQKIESLLSRIIANKALVLVKLISSSGVNKDRLLAQNIYNKCSTGKKLDRELVKEIVAANEFIKQRMLTLPKDNKLDQNIDYLKNNLVNSIEYKTFY